MTGASTNESHSDAGESVSSRYRASEVVDGVSWMWLREAMFSAGLAVPTSHVEADVEELPIRLDCGQAIKAVVTFGARRQRLFVKRQADASTREAPHYHYLSRAGAPVPHLYASGDDDQGREVLVIEFVEPVCDSEESLLADADLFAVFLRATAAFNAAIVEPPYRQLLRCQDWAANLRTAAHHLRRLDDLMRGGDLGPMLASFCHEQQGNIELLAGHALALSEVVGEMQVGLCHQDHHHLNVGWRVDSKQMLIFDLELVELMPRFWDLAQWIGAPDAVRRLPVPRAELARLYIDVYFAGNRKRISAATLVDQARTLWETRELCDTWWRLDAATRTDQARIPFCNHLAVLIDNMHMRP
jgi:hypothetical protein